MEIAPAVRKFILEKFSKYYEEAEPDVSEVERREFGVGWFAKKIESRHKSFRTMAELKSYCMRETPLYISYSVAYYELPAATPMERKGWLGADVVFDIDMHANTKFGVYGKLEQAKTDAIRLIEDFLCSDFGIDKKDILLVFSGNRGYHVHVRDEKFRSMQSEERREMVDYVKGSGLNYLNFFSMEEMRRGAVRLKGPKPDDWGFRGRFARRVIDVLQHESQRISRKFRDENERKEFMKGIAEGNWGRTSVNGLVEKLQPIAQELPLSTVDTDASVTQDVSRLIRLPNSIHGETGLVAKVVRNAESFDPLKDALAFGKGTIEVKGVEDIPALEFGGESFDGLKKDERRELPQSFAMFLILKGSALPIV